MRRAFSGPQLTISFVAAHITTMLICLIISVFILIEIPPKEYYVMILCSHSNSSQIHLFDIVVW